MIINHIARIANLLHMSPKEATAYCEEVRRASGLGKQLSDAAIARHFLGKKPPYPNAIGLAAIIKQQGTAATARETVPSVKPPVKESPAERTTPQKSTADGLKASPVIANTGFVKCPFCNKQVKTKQLADHAKQFHANDAKTVAKKPKKHAPLMEGIEVSSSSLNQPNKNYFVDESGVLVASDLLQLKLPKNNHNEKKNNLIPNPTSSRRLNRAPQSTFEGVAGKSKGNSLSGNTNMVSEPGALRSMLYDALASTSQARKGTRVPCPFCKITVKSSSLVAHLQKIHREEFKTTMAQLNSPSRQQNSKDAKAPAPSKKELALNTSNFDKSSTKVEKLDEAVYEANALIQPDLVSCPHCTAKVKPNRLKKHFAKVHPGAKSLNVQTPTLKSSTLEQRPKSNSHIKITRHVSSKEINYTGDISTGEILFAICPLCNSKIKPAVLKDHFARRHPYATLDNWQSPSHLKTIQRKSTKVQPTKAEKAGLGWKEDQIQALEALRQSFDEPRDGSKGLGHMRREGDGKFGSFPLHDDYSDEADAE